MSSKSCSFCFLEAFSSWISLCMFLHSVSISATICFSFAILVFFSLTMPSVIPFSWARIGFKWSSWYFILSCSSCLMAFSNSSLWQFQIYCGGYLHSLVIVFPLFAEDLAFLLDLRLDVIAQLLQPLLEFVLESVKSGMDVVHGLHCLLSILLDFSRLDQSLWQAFSLTCKYFGIATRAVAWTRSLHFSYLRSRCSCPSFGSWACQDFRFRVFWFQSWWVELIIISFKFY